MPLSLIEIETLQAAGAEACKSGAHIAENFKDICEIIGGHNAEDYHEALYAWEHGFKQFAPVSWYTRIHMLTDRTYVEVEIIVEDENAAEWVREFVVPIDDPEYDMTYYALRVEPNFALFF